MANLICDELAKGRSLVSICEGEEMPGRTTVRQWLEKNTEFATMYARAREDQADTLADQIVAIADEDPGTTEHGTDAGKVAHLRLKVDARKWVASKLKPKAYGEKLDLSGHITTDPAKSLEAANVRAAALAAKLRSDGEAGGSTPPLSP